MSAIMLLSERVYGYWTRNESEDADVEPGKAGENLGKSGQSWGSLDLAPYNADDWLSINTTPHELPLDTRVEIRSRTSNSGHISTEELQKSPSTDNILGVTTRRAIAVAHLRSLTNWYNKGELCKGWLPTVI